MLVWCVEGCLGLSGAPLALALVVPRSASTTLEFLPRQRPLPHTEGEMVPTSIGMGAMPWNLHHVKEDVATTGSFERWKTSRNHVGFAAAVGPNSMQVEVLYTALIASLAGFTMCLLMGESSALAAPTGVGAR